MISAKNRGSRLQFYTQQQQQRPSLFKTLFIIFVYQSIVHSQASSSDQGGLLDVWMLNGKKGLLVARRDKNAVVALTSPASCPLFFFVSINTETNRVEVCGREEQLCALVPVPQSSHPLLCYWSPTFTETDESDQRSFRGGSVGGGGGGGSKGIARTLNWFWIPSQEGRQQIQSQSSSVEEL